MILSLLFFAASDYHHPLLALRLAQYINQRFPTLKNQKYLAEAYILNHQPLPALEIIEKLRAANIKDADIYISALSLAAKQYPAYRTKLRNALIELLATQPISKKERRDIAYLLIDYGFKDDASIIFQDLAFGKPFKNSDVQSLLDIWGENPSLVAIEWIFNRAKSSRGNEKALWLNYLLEIKQPQAVTAIVTWDELSNIKIADAYLEALQTLKDDREIGRVISYILTWENPFHRLKHLAKIAQDMELNKLAEQVYYKAFEMQSHDKEIVKQLALISMALGKYTNAGYFFRIYYCLDPWGDYLINYNYGALLVFKKKEKLAQEFFKLALCQLAVEQNRDIYVQMTEAQLLYLTKNYDAAIALYAKILDQDPGNLSLRADFGNMLLDLQRFQYAEAILFACYVPYKKDLVHSQMIKSERDLEIAKARYWKEKRRLRIATDKADDLIAFYPESAEVLQHKANVEQDIGRWRSAIVYLDMAQDLNPENEIYSQAQKDIFRPHRALQLIGGEYRVTKSTQNGVEEIDRYARLQLSKYIYPYTKFIIKGETDQIYVLDFQNTKGDIYNFNGLRHREELSLIHQFINGTTLIGSLYYAPGVFGAGMDSAFVDYYGFTNFIFEYHRPNWDFPQTTVEQGSRDRFRMGRHNRIGTRVDVDAGAAIQQYNLKGVSCAVSTYAFQALVAYRLPQYYGIGSLLGEGGEISLNYSLDAEFYMKLRTFIDPTGVPFNPIPFFNRADNRFFIACNKKYYRNLEYLVYAGFLYDAVSGGKWPGICGVLLNIGSGDHWQLHMQYIHDVSISIQNSFVDSVLINLDLYY